MRIRYLSISCVVVFLLCGLSHVLWAQKGAISIAFADTLPGPGHGYFEKGLFHENNYDSDSARIYFSLALRYFDEAADYKGAVKAYNRLGNFFFRQGRYHQADSILNKGISIAEKHLDVDDPLFGAANYVLGGIHIEFGHLDLARSIHAKSLENRILNHGATHPDVALGHYEIGRTFYLQSDYVKALELFQKALDIQLKLDLEPKVLAHTYNAIGAVFYFIADYTNSKRYFEKGLHAYLDGAEFSYSVFSTSILNNLGAVAYQEGDYEGAYDYYIKVRQWEQDNLPGDHPYVATTYFNIAEVYMETGKLEDAICYFNKALKMRIKIYGPLHNAVASSHRNLGTSYLKSGDLKSALRHFRSALSIGQTVDINWEDRAILFEKLADTFTAQEKIDSAHFYYDLAEDTYRQMYAGIHPAVAEIFLKRSVLSESKGDWNQALMSSQEAFYSVLKVGATAPYGLDDFEHRTKAIDVLGRHARLTRLAYEQGEIGLDDLKEAISYLLLAVDLIRQKLALAVNEKSQIAFAERYASFFEEGIQMAFLIYRDLADPFYLNTAFVLMESNKGLTLNQSIQDRQDPIDFEVSDSLLTQERNIKVEIAYYEETILNQKGNRAGHDTSLVKEFEDRLFYLQRDFEALKQGLQSEYPKYYDLKYNHRTLSLEELRRALTNDELLIEYFVGEQSIMGMAISKTQTILYELPVNEMLKDSLQVLEQVFMRPDLNISANAFGERSYAMYQRLMEPMLMKLNADPGRLIIIPAGQLAHVNFDLMVDAPPLKTSDWKQLSYLIKKYPISIAYSGTILFGKNSIKPAIGRDLLAFSFGEDGQAAGDHVSMEVVRSSDLSDLPGGVAEVKTISDMVEGDYYFGEFASEQTFKEIASDYQVLHLALHGSVDEVNPDYSRLHFHSADTLEDGKLHVFELYNMQLHADLAVLSACNTGTGKYQTGEGIMSLGHAFSYAGVNSLLLTRWDLSDEAAPEIMKSFYRELKRGMNKSEALRTAKLEYLENASMFRSNPFYWGSFFVMGNDAPVKLTRSNRSSYWAIGGLLCLLMIGYVLKRRI